MANGKQTSYFYAIFGIALVLFVVGVAAVLVIEAKRVSTDFKENLTVELVLRDSVNTDSLQMLVKGQRYVKSIKFVSKDEAAKILAADLPEDFMDILGYNPLYSSFHLNLYETYINNDSFEIVSGELGMIPEIKQVNFQKNVLQSLDAKVRSASAIILVIAAALLVFAVSLIFSTIRLAMFSNRFSIKTQQLFGATRWFIIRPFLGRSLLNGFIGGAVACAFIAALLGYFNYTFPELGLQEDLVTFGLLFGSIILFGILISFISTLTAVLRYLRLKLEDLY